MLFLFLPPQKCPANCKILYVYSYRHTRTQFKYDKKASSYFSSDFEAINTAETIFFFSKKYLFFNNSYSIMELTDTHSVFSTWINIITLPLFFFFPTDRFNLNGAYETTVICFCFFIIACRLLVNKI